MNKNVKKLWTDALRSGEYKKGVGYLRKDDNTYCCLGVLCELAVKDNVILEPTLLGEKGVFLYEGNDVHLPGSVLVWAGLNNISPYVTQNYKNRPLTAVNDEGTPFTEIANLIERDL